MKEPTLEITPCHGKPFNVLVKQEKSKNRVSSVRYFLILEYPDRKAVIYYMNIDKNQRGKGYGSFVLKKLQDSFCHIETQVLASTDESIKWLKSKGFIEKGDDLVWERTEKP